MIINEEYCLFATANYQDRGTNTLIAPMVDRFDVMVESKHPGPNIASTIAMEDMSGKFLRHIEYEKKFNEILLEQGDYHDKLKRIEDLCGRFAHEVEKEFQVKLLSLEERAKIREDFHQFLSISMPMLFSEP